MSTIKGSIYAPSRNYIVRLYNRDTGALVANSTTSNNAFTFNVTDTTIKYYVVVIDPLNELQAGVYDNPKIT